jgi:hypothetical protein
MFSSNASLNGSGIVLPSPNHQPYLNMATIGSSNDDL